MEAFDVFGIETVCSLKGKPGHLSPGELWQQCHKDGEYERLFTNTGDLPTFVAQDLCKIHGVENYRKTEEGTFPYMLCAFASNNSNMEGYQVA